MIRRALLIVAVLLVSACGDSHDSTIDDGASALNATKARLEKEIDELIAKASPTAERFTALPLSGTEADRELAKAARLSHVIDVVTLNDQASVQAVQPEEYSEILGTVLADQEHINMLRSLGIPLLSNYFLALEGVPAIALEFPLQSESTYKGSVSFLIDHVGWFSDIAQSILRDSGYGMSMQQLDGVVLWDTDATQIGMNVFTDEKFADNGDWVRQVHEIVASEEGTGSYVWASESAEPIQSSCTWSTIRRANAEWRLVIYWEQ